MTQKTLGEKKEYPVVTPDIYEAEVLEVSEAQNTMYPTYENGDPRIEVTFKFRIEDGGEFDGAFVWGRTTPTFTTSPDCKLRKWIEAILGVTELPLGYVIEFDDLVSKSVRIFVQHTSTGKAKVADVLPLKGGATPAVPAAAATATQHPVTQASQAAPAAAYSDDFGDEPF